MTTYHRFIIANSKVITLEQLCDAVRKTNSNIDFDHEVVFRDGIECGILIDVTTRGNTVFDEDMKLVQERLSSTVAIDHRTRNLLNLSQCMVTTQVYSSADESVLDIIWSVLSSYLSGILVLEDYASTIRYYE